MPSTFETLLFPGTPPGFGAAGGSSGATEISVPRRVRGTGKPLVAYDPTEPSPRLRRLTQVVAAVFNSLSRRGDLVSDSAGEWAIAPNPFSMARDPLPADDAAAGVLLLDHWVNTETGTVWLCTSPSTGVAVWKRITLGS